jgi:uncharacterized membrane protein
MTKNEYMQQLREELEKNQIPDTEDIILEYEQHFIMKMNDGYTEEEIAVRLGSPEHIAGQFLSLSDSETTKKPKHTKGVKALLVSGLALVDVIMVCIFVALYSWVIALAVLSSASFIIGFFVASGLRFNELIIPYTPFIGGLLLGLSLFAFGLLSAVGTVFSHIYTIRLMKVYLRWHKNTLSSNPLPPLSFKPELSGKFRRRMRALTILSAVIFAVLSVTANIVLFAYADFQPYWHAWGWFQ